MTVLIVDGAGNPTQTTGTVATVKTAIDNALNAAIAPIRIEAREI